MVLGPDGAIKECIQRAEQKAWKTCNDNLLHAFDSDGGIIVCIKTVHTASPLNLQAQAEMYEEETTAAACNKYGGVCPPLHRASAAELESWNFMVIIKLFCTGHLQFRSKKFSVHEYLRRFNKPSIKSIQSPDGDIIDCVHRRKQPAFDHPLLKNHKIKDPPRRPNRSALPLFRNRTGHSVHAIQSWRLSGDCPKGTVPVRRTTREDLMRVASPQSFGKKIHGPARPIPKPDSNGGNGHEHAIVYVEGQQYYGAKATLNVWAPRIQGKYEFSLSQLWVLSGSFEGSDLNSIEAGWQVSPELYGDMRPRLFTYWTSDAYRDTGCYNLLCSGFIQMNNNIAVGASISPVSQFEGPQYDISILVWKDPREGNWWMEFGDGSILGYWPAELFTHLGDSANMLQWGGEIVNTEQNGEHTSTQMGSGHFAEEGFSKASYFRNIEIVDEDNSLRPPDALLSLAEFSNCYDVRVSYSGDWGSHVYFGGPGNNPNCH